MNRLKDDPFLSFHDFVVFLDDQFFCAFAVQFRSMILFLLKLLLDVSDQKILAERGMNKVLFSLWIHELVVAS